MEHGAYAAPQMEWRPTGGAETAEQRRRCLRAVLVQVFVQAVWNAAFTSGSAARCSRVLPVIVMESGAQDKVLLSKKIERAHMINW